MKQDFLNQVAYASLEPHDAMKAVYQGIIEGNKSLTAKQRMEQQIRDELEFHEGGATKKYRPPPEEYAKKLSVIEKYEDHKLNNPDWMTINDAEDDTPHIPVLLFN